MDLEHFWFCYFVSAGISTTYATESSDAIFSNSFYINSHRGGEMELKYLFTQVLSCAYLFHLNYSNEISDIMIIGGPD